MVAVPLAVVFRYAPGAAHFRFTSDATIAVIDSALTPQRNDAEQHVQSESWMSVELARDNSGMTASVRVDSATTSPARLAIMGSGLPRVSLPIRARFRTSAEGTVVLPDSGREPRAPRDTTGLKSFTWPCTGEERALLDPALELFPRVPPSLSSGTRWSDTLRVLTCRSGVPVRMTRVRDLELTTTGPAAPTASYASRVTFDGSRLDRGTTVTLRGEGSERGALTLDAAAGTIKLDEGQRSVRVVLRLGAQSRTLLQSGSYRVERVP